MNKNHHDTRQYRRYNCHTDRAEQPFFAFILRGDIRFQILRARNSPRPCVPDPKAVNEKTVDKVHYRQNNEQLPKSRNKSARTVYRIYTDKHIRNIAGYANCLEKQRIPPYSLVCCKSQFYAAVLHRAAVKMHHTDSALANAHGADQNEQNPKP